VIGSLSVVIKAAQKHVFRDYLKSQKTVSFSILMTIPGEKRLDFTVVVFSRISTMINIEIFAVFEFIFPHII
jgi:hypothetical protein